MLSWDWLVVERMTGCGGLLRDYVLLGFGTCIHEKPTLFVSILGG
jgi:hypothetical protein